MDKIKIKVSAKLNLTLDVVGVRDDGFHELDSVMCSVNVYDRISVKRCDGNRIVMNGKLSDESNIAYKTIALAINECKIAGAEVSIKKGIPFSAGMGGSSADASGILYCLKSIYGIDDLAINALARRLGSDTNFMLDGGISRCCGKGDLITKLNYRKIHFAVIKPRYGVNTAKVFADYDKLIDANTKVKFTDKFLENYENNDMSCFEYLHNDLQLPSTAINEGVARAISDMSKYTPYVTMTGSGSAVFGVFENENAARFAANSLESKYFFSRYAQSTEKGIIEN